MELPNRLELEAAFARRLSRLSSQHRRELIALMGFPPDPAKVPEEFWQRVEKEENDTVAAILLLLMMQSAEMHFGSLPDFARVNTSVDAFIPQVEQAANQRAADFARQYAQTGREKLDDFAGEIKNRYDIGGEIYKQDVADKAADIFGPARDARIANNELTRARVFGGEIVFGGTVGISSADIWRNRPALSKSGPCPICKPLDGTPRSYWGRFFPQGPPSPHPGCILPGQLVELPGEVAAAAKSFYDGICVEITLSNGCRFSVTENHPVLTLSGWKAAQHLGEGENVVSCRFGKSAFTPIDPNYNGRPALIEQVFESLAMLRGVSARCVPSTAEAFHGDGKSINGDIEIVFSDRQLRSRVEAAHRQHVNQRSLIMGRNNSAALSGLGKLDSLGLSRFPAFNRRMRSGHLHGSLVGSGIAPPHSSRLLRCPRCNSSLKQPLPDEMSGSAVLRSKAALMLAGPISRDNLVSPVRPEWLLTGKPESSHHASVSHPFVKRNLPDSTFFSKCLRILSSNKAIANIRKVSRFLYSGHVFDLQVNPLHVFSVGGAIVSNCVCEIEYINAGVPA